MRVGIAGLRRGQSYVRVFSELSDCEVVAISDPVSDLVSEVGEMWDVGARYEQYEDLLDADIDTVVVATPGPMHASQAIQALDADLNVLSEVPAAWSIQECWKLVDAAERSRGIYTLAENMCYFHYLMEWRDRIRAGEIGKITYAEAEYVHDCSVRMAAGNWRKDMPPLYYCTHSLGPVLDILSDRCVQAIGLSTGNQTNPGIEAADLEVGLFTTADGVTVKILCGFSVCREPAFHWQVFYGTEGVIENGRPGDSAKMFRAGDTAMREIRADVTDPGLATAVTGGHGNSESLLAADFVRAVHGEGPNPIDVYRGIEMTAPGICAHVSALSGGQQVSIPDFRTTKD
jgi:predicted dehydrogenase